MEKVIEINGVTKYYGKVRGNIFALFLFAVIFFLLAVWLFERKDIYA